ncbi:DNA fragmentation factor subunit beta-like [Macrosteles quadrilineatus]|uniref:DNA fragmentation factor subunit beta-like n=1 Tax=Macrosteles quadrilineatus TaxID=74068 RepID=UPI0023E0CB30|nr:DNA fragmentation factor subunit beta-like [Macrosteles quadrilineatus]
MKGTMKGFKVSDAKRSRIVGVACKTLEELVNKGRTKLQIPSKSNVRVFLPDGTEVESEEYFVTLPAQSVLLLKQDNEDFLTGADLIYNTLRYVNIDFLRAGEKVREFFDENIKEKVRVLAEVLSDKKSTDCKTFFSRKDDDPDWFLGLETNATTKEAFMFRRSQERVRGYLYKTKSDMKKSSLYTNNNEFRDILDDIFTNLSKTLNKDKYFGCYFDRSAEGALCNDTGEFKCSGVWKSKECLYNGGKSHLINPYTSREERIVFSTWNLDHCIERSRSIIPALMNAAEFVVCNRDKDCEVNVPYFYSLLFTSQNLRLVHIVCHDKGKHHSAQCDPNMFTVNVQCKTKDSPKNKKECGEGRTLVCAK